MVTGMGIWFKDEERLIYLLWGTWIVYPQNQSPQVKTESSLKGPSKGLSEALEKSKVPADASELQWPCIIIAPRMLHIHPLIDVTSKHPNLIENTLTIYKRHLSHRIPQSVKSVWKYIFIWFMRLECAWNHANFLPSLHRVCLDIGVEIQQAPDLLKAHVSTLISDERSLHASAQLTVHDAPPPLIPSRVVHAFGMMRLHCFTDRKVIAISIFPDFKMKDQSPSQSIPLFHRQVTDCSQKNWYARWYTTISEWGRELWRRIGGDEQQAKVKQRIKAQICFWTGNVWHSTTTWTRQAEHHEWQQTRNMAELSHTKNIKKDFTAHSFPEDRVRKRYQCYIVNHYFISLLPLHTMIAILFFTVLYHHW